MAGTEGKLVKIRSAIRKTQLKPFSFCVRAESCGGYAERNEAADPRRLLYYWRPAGRAAQIYAQNILFP